MTIQGFEIRAMTAGDVDAAVALARAHGWRDRYDLYEIVLRVPTCQALVGTLEGRLVATGLGTVSLPVGWVGSIVVAAEEQRRGIGRAMTEEICARLRAAGCETLTLVATDAGRPMYERMGFRLATYYHQLQGEHLDERPVPPAGTRVRPLRPADLPAVFELDRAATAEDRSAILAVVAEAGGWLLEEEGAGGSGAGRGGGLRGFLLPTERAYGAVIAPRPEDGIYLLNLHRHLVAPAYPTSMKRPCASWRPAAGRKRGARRGCFWARTSRGAQTGSGVRSTRPWAERGGGRAEPGRTDPIGGNCQPPCLPHEPPSSIDQHERRA